MRNFKYLRARSGRLLAIATAAALLAGCQILGLPNGNTERPKGPGANTDDLRASPCACVEVPSAAPDAATWLELRLLGAKG